MCTFLNPGKKELITIDEVIDQIWELDESQEVGNKARGDPLTVEFQVSGSIIIIV